MIDPNIEKAINEQINHEIYSAYLYYGMASYFERQSLDGFSRWLRVQALEELTHVQKFFSYLHERGGQMTVMPIEAPEMNWETPLEVFQHVYEHETQVTKKVNTLLDLAIARSDHATSNFLQWFVAEQVEEESSADKVVQKLKLVDRTEGGLFLLDQEMGKRSFVPPPDILTAF